jgi:hypothetical protein
MAARPPDSLERLTQADLIGVVRELIGEVGRLRAENEKLSGAFAELKTEHQAVKDELARLKSLPIREHLCAGVLRLAMSLIGQIPTSWC